MIILLHLLSDLYEARIPVAAWYLANIDYFRAWATRSPW